MDASNRVQKGSPPLRVHDRIVAVNGVRVDGTALSQTLSEYHGRGVVLTVVRVVRRARWDDAATEVDPSLPPSSAGWRLAIIQQV